MKEKTDAQLVVESLAGDSAAFREIVDRTQQMVYRVAFRLLRDMHEAEDVVQEVYLRVWKNLSQYRTNVKLTTWMYTITTNRCLDVLKSHRRNSSVPLDDVLPDGAGTPQVMMEEKELSSEISRAAENLPPKQKAVFVLRDLEGLSIDVTSDILNMNEGSVKSNLYHARKNIHQEILRRYQITDRKL